MADQERETPRGNVRMPIDDRIPPEEWVAEQPSGPSPTLGNDALAEEQRRRREIEYGAGGAPG
ncbi:hypothetical protein [Actinomycetospora aeridis]|uniref:Uncharacterized protein n=1 Tax=Actinomycetospora aeridis TaxID=3129231 RepID=A0ABU8N3U9_9PSEU